MKKCLFLFILLFSPVITSGIQYACSNQTQVISNSEEIQEGGVKSILSLPLGVCDASESSHFQWIESTIFFDANLISLHAPNETNATELFSGNNSISYSVIEDDKVTLIIDSSTGELELGECSEIGGLVAMIKSIDNSGTSIEILVATKKTTLNTKQKPSEIIEVNSIKYAIQLLTGSQTESTIKLSKCNNGDIYELAETIPAQNQSTTNSTINSSISNQTISNETIINSTAINQSEQNSTLNNQPSYAQEKGFFRKIIDWFKELFS